ncbi:hypothetical protein C8R47DRAFT_996073, partial [Mycena vitilis]
VASRPEVHIRETLQDALFDGISDSVNVEQSFNDVRMYLTHEFKRIRCEHENTMSHVPTPWPPLQIIENLVEKSSGYFVYASMIIKFIDDKYSRPTERLEAIQALNPSGLEEPFAALDQLYIQILSGVPIRFQHRLCDILQCLVLKVKLTAPQIDRLLQLQPGDTELILRGLHSVLDMDSADSIPTMHHASFVDFLQDQGRSGNFHIKLENRMNVARGLLEALSSHNKWLEGVHDPLAWYEKYPEPINFS